MLKALFVIVLIFGLTESKVDDQCGGLFYIGFKKCDKGEIWFVFFLKRLLTTSDFLIILILVKLNKYILANMNQC